MNHVAKANRKHIGFYGVRNAGKSSLMNAVIGQDLSIVSDVKGTTTDPVEKTMELIPAGPVVLIDTAGLDDFGELGQKRVSKSIKMLQGMDVILYIIDSEEVNQEGIRRDLELFKRYDIPVLLVMNKIDKLTSSRLKALKEKYTEAVFVSAFNMESVLMLKDKLIKMLQERENDPSLLDGILSYGDSAIFVIPIDSEAPKGRIILPQVQCMRDALDHGIMTYVVRDTELEIALQNMKDVKLVVTDSQAFKKVESIIPKDMPLTGFSILFARHKGDLGVLVEGANKIDYLQDGAKVLISESCTHNFSHEDIGRVKIPNLMRKYTGKDIQFEFMMGKDFPEDVEEYDLIIHCGSCMLNRKTMMTRIRMAQEKGVPITNYGIVLAHLNGILERSIQMFEV